MACQEAIETHVGLHITNTCTHYHLTLNTALAGAITLLVNKSPRIYCNNFKLPLVIYQISILLSSNVNVPV